MSTCKFEQTIISIFDNRFIVWLNLKCLKCKSKMPECLPTWGIYSDKQERVLPKIESCTFSARFTLVLLSHCCYYYTYVYVFNLLASFRWLGIEVVKAPQDVHVTNLDSSNGKATAIVQWAPHSESMNCFYTIYWMSADSGDNGYIKLSVRSYNLLDLHLTCCV